MYRDGPTDDASEQRAFKLDELAAEADVSVRTIRYYVQRGLLAPPVFRGRDTVYGEGHLNRLRLIKRLQDERYLPLDAIASELEGKSDADVRLMLDRLDRSIKSERPEPETVAGDGPFRARLRPVTRSGGERWVKFVLADGVELSVREDAGWDAEALAERVRASLGRRR
ncbi:MAG: MerR family transcriptional regulator [Myxococcales bacterium]|nr:MerR family transcriptional regulator [Myxococcales bacterium]